ncbi:MAG: hypothetical protein WKF92_03915 [Pyrinomonadaceae bacterium]
MTQTGDYVVPSFLPPGGMPMPHILNNSRDRILRSISVEPDFTGDDNENAGGFVRVNDER